MGPLRHIRSGVVKAVLLRHNQEVRRVTLAALLALLAFAPSSGAIVGGKETTRNWPHMAALEFRDRNGNFNFICGASLIRPDVILTAAHCIDGTEQSPERYQLRIGSRDRTAGGELIGVTKIVEHPQYNSNTGAYDVATLKLSRAASMGSAIRIAEPTEAERFAPRDVATIIGWGSTFSGDPIGTRRLHEADVPIRTDAECRQFSVYAADYDPATMLCAGFELGGADSCQGDSGGPMMVPDAAGKIVLVGVVSFGTGCGFPTQYGVYAKAAGSTLRPWIDARANELSPAPAPAAAAPTEIGQPAPAPAPGGQPGGQPSGGGESGSGSEPESERASLPARLSVPSRLGSAARARRVKRLSVLVRSTSSVRLLRARISQRSHTVARGSRSSLARKGRITLKPARNLRAGKAFLIVTARDSQGRNVRVVRRVRISR